VTDEWDIAGWLCPGVSSKDKSPPLSHVFSQWPLGTYRNRRHAKPRWPKQLANVYCIQVVFWQDHADKADTALLETPMVGSPEVDLANISKQF
jgi:hypothetical protein